ncbi:MAG: hypothetical protein ACRDYU_16200 [Actinomycetes bacterium]
MRSSTEAGVSRYRIVVAGELGDLLAHAFAPCAVATHDGTTEIVATARDQTEFYGWLERCRDLALHVVSVTELDRTDDAASR